MVPRVTPSTRMATPGTGAGTGLEQYETVPDIPGPPLVAHGVGVGVGVPIGVAVAVAVAVGDGLGVGWTSKEPMSIRPLETRGYPR